MKTYSNDAVSKTDITNLDAKQTKQIQQLRIALAIVGVANLVVAIVLHLL
jgi:hypothetical protein